ncbi:MAG: purine-nucleoside phosphorylase, partial [Bacteroidetes bacterium]|nr:purine-nucleoside phosphorylase [Bacteroidota bacterium]
MDNSRLNDSLTYLRSKIAVKPRIAVILGSGLGDFADQISSPLIVPTSEIPNYPVSTVPGHAGKIIFGTIENNKRKSSQLVVFQGR